MDRDEKVLFVDDDALVLKDFIRLFGRRYRVSTAPNVVEAMKWIHQEGPFAVVISDLKMPLVDGVTFFKRLHDTIPDTVRILLTGHGSLDAAMDAINQGHIFRFLTKPCAPEILDQAIQGGIRQYHLVVAERELLENTLKGAIHMLVGVLGLTNPIAFNRAARIQPLVQQMMAIFNPASPWEWETATILSQIGCTTLFPEIIETLYLKGILPPEERALYDEHPLVGARLVRPIPRLEMVADIIAHQERLFDGRGPGSQTGEKIPLAARVLKVALDFDLLKARHNDAPNDQLLKILQSRSGWYDPKVLEVFAGVMDTPRLGQMREVTAGTLLKGMILGRDLVTKDGRVLLKSGSLVTQAVVERINLFRQGSGIEEPILVCDLIVK
ncbi:MAG: response regulator [Magnetococcales bacterium]|nr:response regulator [Magnetococcales bacterium]NGZ27144.1 response regulator [Magnetococcales bacterium]